MLVRSGTIIALFKCDSNVGGREDDIQRDLAAFWGARARSRAYAQFAPRAPYTRALFRAQRLAGHENRPRAAHLPGTDLRPAALLVRRPVRDPRALRYGGRCRHLSHRDVPLGGGARAVARRLRAALAPPD